MKRCFFALTFFLILVIPSFAQEDTPLCTTPFVTDVPESNRIIAIDSAQVTSEMFINRLRFEHAYNAIKFEIRVTQINNLMQASGGDAAGIIANDPQVRQINVENDNPEQLANRVLGDLAADAIVWDYADKNDLSLNTESLEASIAQFFNVDATSDEYQSLLASFTERLLSDAAVPTEIDTFFCRQAIYNLVQEDVIGNPETTLYVNVDNILVNSQEVAQDIINLLAEGEDFATLAQELSLDIGSADNGGALGWQPAVFFISEFANAVTTADVGSILEPLQTQFGWHVIRLNGREERPIPDEQRNAIIESLFTRWREQQIADASVNINPDWQSFIPEL